MRLILPTVLPAGLTALGAGMLLVVACTGQGQQPQVTPGTAATPGASPGAASPAPKTAVSPSPAAKAPSPSPAAKVPSPSPAAKVPSPSPAAKVASPSPSPSPGAALIAVRDHPQLGRMLTDGAGRTLYQFSQDTRDMSNCTGTCAQNWPPLPAPTGALTAPPGITGTLGVITRPDGARQVTYNGIPLYYFMRDTQPGDTNGAQVNNWSVVNPGG